MNWLLPPDVDEERFYDLYTLAMSAWTVCSTVGWVTIR